jgi:predicted nucleotidyltransferase
MWANFIKLDTDSARKSAKIILETLNINMRPITTTTLPPDSVRFTTREDEIRQMLRDMFARSAHRLTQHRVVIFGSRARGDAKPRSDFDLGVIGEAPLPLKDFYALSDELDQLKTLYRFDWVDLARASERFRHAALKNTEVVYEA